MKHKVAVACAGLTLLATLAVVAGCGSTTQVFSTDLTRQAGLYVVGYSTNPALRRDFEDQLVGDLRVRGMVAFPSHLDIADISSSSAAELIGEANRKGAVGVVLVNQATAQGSGSPVQNPARVTPLHPDIQTFYALSRDEMVDVSGGSEPVFAEVNLFLLDGADTRLFWSGTTWAFQEDDRAAAVSQVSGFIADQMSKARDEFAQGGPAPN